MISELCVVAILAEYVEEEGRSFQEPRPSSCPYSPNVGEEVFPKLKCRPR
jgi:hypothetical protein